MYDISGAYMRVIDMRVIDMRVRDMRMRDMRMRGMRVTTSVEFWVWLLLQVSI